MLEKLVDLIEYGIIPDMDKMLIKHHDNDDICIPLVAMEETMYMVLDDIENGLIDEDEAMDIVDRVMKVMRR